MANQLTDIYLALLDFVEPLRRRLQTPDALEYLFYRYGWTAPMDDAGLTRFRQVATVIAPLEQFVQTAQSLRQKLAANPEASLDASDVATLADAAAHLIRALAEFKPSDLGGLSDPFARAEFWESIAEQVFDDLLEEYLRIYHPGFYLVLRLWNVVRYDATTPTEPSRRPYTRTWFDWAQASSMLQDPLQALKQAYHWGDPAHPFEHQHAIEALKSLLGALHVPARLFAPALKSRAPFPSDPNRGIRDDVSALRVTLLERDFASEKAFYKIGFEVFPALRNGDASPSGLMVKPVLEGGAEKTLPLSDWLDFQFSVAAGIGDTVGFALFPDDASVVGGAPTIGTSVELATRGSGPWYPLGNARTSHVEISGFSVKLSLEGSVDDPEIKLRLACMGAAGAPGCKVVLTLGDSDSFVQKTVDRSGLEFACSPEILWSSKTGFAFNGRPEIAIDVPLSISLGPVTLTDATIELKDGPQTGAGKGIACQVGVGIVGKLGPIAFVIQKMGFIASAVPYSRSDVRALPPGEPAPALGSIGFDLAFAPPKAVGLSVDAGIVTGGGFLGHDGDEYMGALELSVGRIAVKAYGLIQTKLPGGAPGYSAVVVISTEFSPSIQLPFGFSLDGVGGLLGLHRTISIEAVQTALWGHHLDGLLFPKDPITTAPQLMSALDAYFPPAKDRYVFGPLAKIGWASDIVQGELALLIEVPEPLKLLLIGEIQVVEPVEDPQLELHISFDGGIDFGKKLAFFDATIHDSRIVSYPLSGDLAFRYGWGEEKVFALSLGGFHPHFQPPAGFPALKRLAISISSSVAQLEAQSYLALTSNTLQFGARVELTAGTGSFNVHGWLGFDALCERHPLSFTFDLSAGVDLRHGTDVLASVHLDGQLSGPSPWHIAGEASLSLLFFDVTVHFDKTWGDVAGLLAALDPLALMLAALGDRSSFGSVLPAAVRAAGSTAGAPSDATGTVLLDPAGSLRIVQRVAQLGQPISRFNGASLGRTLQLSMDALSVFGSTITQPRSTSEEFAPAQFLELTDAQKLSLPSFSRFDAGVEVGGDAIDLGQSPRTRAVMTPFTYNTTIVDTFAAKRAGNPYVLDASALLAMNDTAGAPRRGLDRYAPPPGSAPRVVLEPERWVVAGVADLALRADIASDGSKLGAQLALERHLVAYPEQRGRLQIVLAEEAT